MASARFDVRICLRDLEELKQPRVAHAVVDARPFAAALEEVVPLERGEVLRGAARVERERGLQLADRPLARRGAARGS